jgi:hypothetical protein
MEHYEARDDEIGVGYCFFETKDGQLRLYRLFAQHQRWDPAEDQWRGHPPQNLSPLWEPRDYQEIRNILLLPPASWKYRVVKLKMHEFVNVNQKAGLPPFW